MDIKKCIPENKYDTGAIERANLIGFPALNSIAPDLLVWVQDSNWPVAAQTASLLSTAGPEIAPHIKAILSSDDSIWKYWTIELVIANLTPGVRAELRSDLVRLVNHPSHQDKLEKVDAIARVTLTL